MFLLGLKIRPILNNSQKLIQFHVCPNAEVVDKWLLTECKGNIIFEFTKEGVDFLFKEGAEIIILACNSASSEALRKIQQEYLPKKYPNKRVLGVIIPACEEAVLSTKNKNIEKA